MRFSDLLEPRPVAPGRFAFEVPDGWQQGRGAFGGLVLGALARASIRSEPDRDRRLRALTGEIAGPVLPGAAELEVVSLKRGSAVSFVRVSLTQGGEVVAHAVCTLGKDRPGMPAWQRIAAPEPPPWRDTFAPEYDPAIWPVFTQHFEFRPTGPFPYFGGEEPVASGWLRPREDGGRDEAWLCGVADGWWPAAAVTFDGPRPTATISFTLQIVGDPASTEVGAPLFHRGVSPVAAAGYAVESRELWTDDGRLLCLNHQTFVIIK